MFNVSDEMWDSLVARGELEVFTSSCSVCSHADTLPALLTAHVVHLLFKGRLRCLRNEQQLSLLVYLFFNSVKLRDRRLNINLAAKVKLTIEVVALLSCCFLEMVQMLFMLQLCKFTYD